MKIRLEGNKKEINDLLNKLIPKVFKAKSISKFYPDRGIPDREMTEKENGRVYVEIE